MTTKQSPGQSAEFSTGLSHTPLLLQVPAPQTPQPCLLRSMPGPMLSMSQMLLLQMKSLHPFGLISGLSLQSWSTEQDGGAGGAGCVMTGREMKFTPNTDKTSSRLGIKTQYKKPSFLLMNRDMIPPVQNFEKESGML